MKRITLMGLAVLVVLATMVATAGAEGTGPKVTLRTAAGPLKKGAPLVALGPFFTFVTEQGDVACPKTTLSGTAKTNTKEKPSGEISTAETRTEGEGPCNSDHAFGVVSVEWQNLPWKLKFTNTGVVQVKTSVGDRTIRVVFTFPKSSGAKCIYATKKWLLSFPVSATPVPLVITSERALFKLVPGSVAGCATEATANGKFEVTSNGEPVEVEVK
jgi:hypothetical protein